MSDMKPKSSKKYSPPKFVLWGAPGAGKSIAACTASAKFDPEKLGKEEQVLDDVIFITTEDGLASLDGLKLEVPCVLDCMQDVLTKDGEPSLPKLEKNLREAFKYVRENATPETIVVFDSLTAMDTFANAFFEKHATRDYEAYKNSIVFHLNQSMALASLPGTVIAIGHGKVSAPIDNEDTKAHKAAKARAAGISDKHMPAQIALTGAASDHYFRQFGEIYYMERKIKRVKGERVVERCIYPQGSDIAGGKTKYEGILNVEEPANLRVIMRKLGIVS